jgi:hypothetical protein
MKMSKIELEKIFNEQFEDLEPNLAVPGPDAYRPRSNMSTEETYIEMLACFKNDGVEAFEEVWERIGGTSDIDYVDLWTP